MAYIKRNFQAEFRAEENGLIRGRPIVVEAPTDIGGMFKEVICKGAIKNETLKDVSFFWNHDLNSKRIARTLIPIDKLGGMNLTVNEDGDVDMVVNPNRKRTDVNDMYLSIEDGTCDGMSFMFGIKKERWEDLDTDYPTRYIEEIDPIIEVSAVNYPAYTQTSIGVRSIAPAETELNVLEKARTHFNKRSNEQRELELEKLKTEILYKIGG